MSQSLRQALNAGQPNELGVGARDVEMGNALGAAVRFVRGDVVGDLLVLPNTAKAAFLMSGFRAVGTAEGPVTVVAGAPGAGEASVTTTGDIQFNNLDAVTVAEVYYATQQGDYAVLELGVTPGAGPANWIAALPSGLLATGVVSATVDLGVGLGAKTVLRRGTTGLAAGECALSASGGAVEFDSADAPVRVTIAVMLTPQPSVADLLEGETNLL